MFSYCVCWKDVIKQVTCPVTTENYNKSKGEPKLKLMGGYSIRHSIRCSTIKLLLNSLNLFFQSAMRVPYLARFFLYARRHTTEEVTLRILCLTEPERSENNLEVQEEFTELCKSDFIEIFDKARTTLLYCNQ